MDQRKRIAIYGGTFDPVHLGHLEIGKKVSQLFAIDEFVFMPARIAPHKVNQESASAFDRHAMLILATQDEGALTVSRFELEGPGRQYTVDTLGRLRTNYGDRADLFFVMGADSWAEITTWREWERLPALANLIVVTRPGHEIANAANGLASQIHDLRGVNESNDVLNGIEPGLNQIFFTDAVMIDVSATAVRKAALAETDQLEKLVPQPVADYIRKYGLYRNKNEA